MKTLNRQYILILIGMCGLIATSIGIIANVSGLFFTPVAEEFDVLKGSVSLTLTIANLCFAFGGLAAPKLLNEQTLRKVLVIGTLCITIPTALLGFSKSLAIMYLLNAVRGFAGGILGYVLVTTVINNWFRSSVGLATSIAMSCSGLTGAILSPFLSSVIQGSGWRTGYFVTAVLTLLFNLPAILFLPSLNPETKGMQAYGSSGQPEIQKNVSDSSQSALSGVLLFAVILFAFQTCGGTALPQHYPGIADSYRMSVSTGAFMLSIGMIVNTISKIMLGAVADRIGSKKSLLIFSAITVAGTVILLIFRTPVMMYAGAALFGLVYALGAVGVVMLTKDMFGLQNYSRVYPVTSLAGTVGNALLASLIGFMYDASGNYVSTLIMMTAMMILNTVIVLVIYRNKTA